MKAWKTKIAIAAVLAMALPSASSAQTSVPAKPPARADANFIATAADLKARIPSQLRITRPDYVVFVPEVVGDKVSDTGNEHFLVFDGPGGSLMAVWTQSSAEAQPDQHIAFSRSTDEGVTWAKPRIIAGPKKAGAGPMASRGMSVVYSRTSDGRRLRPDLPPSARGDLLAKYYYPHHNRLTEAVSACMAEHGNCLLIDGHSFASKPLPHEPDQAPDRCDICIGTDAFHRPLWLSELVVRIFQEQGFDVAVNRPFSGTLVPEKFLNQDSAVLSMMVEINRSLYMDETNGQRKVVFDAFALVLRLSLLQLVAACGQCQSLAATRGGTAVPKNRKTLESLIQEGSVWLTITRGFHDGSSRRSNVISSQGRSGGTKWPNRATSARPGVPA